MSKRLSRLKNLTYPEYVNTFKVTQKTEHQGPACAICGRPQGKKKLAEDHCHETGRRRGKLCSRCNMGIGSFEDDVELLRNAIRYLWHYGK